MTPSTNKPVLLPLGDLTPTQRRKSIGNQPYVRRQRAPGEALPSRLSFWDQPNYCPPASIPVRTGADNHLVIKSVVTFQRP
jgi:hypothetical protein